MSKSSPTSPHTPPGFFNRRGLEPIFDGWVEVKDFTKDLVPPARRGVYMLFRDSLAPPVFLERSSAGRHKGQDPTEDLDVLREKWVEGAHVLYVGKADLKWASGVLPSTDLRKRIDNYIRHGRGKNAGHWGGRYVWQLADSANLEVAWMETPGDPRAMEKRLLSDFADVYGKLPFGNLQS